MHQRNNQASTQTSDAQALRDFSGPSILEDGGGKPSKRKLRGVLTSLGSSEACNSVQSGLYVLFRLLLVGFGFCRSVMITTLFFPRLKAAAHERVKWQCGVSFLLICMHATVRCHLQRF